MGRDVAESDHDSVVVGWGVPTRLVGAEPYASLFDVGGDLLFGVAGAESGGDVETGVAGSCRFKSPVTTLLVDEVGHDLVSFGVDTAGFAEVTVEVAVDDEAVHRSLEEVGWLPVADRSQGDSRVDDAGRVERIAEADPRCEGLENVAT